MIKVTISENMSLAGEEMMVVVEAIGELENCKKSTMEDYYNMNFVIGDKYVLKDVNKMNSNWQTNLLWPTKVGPHWDRITFVQPFSLDRC